jgi:hypothetical protein
LRRSLLEIRRFQFIAQVKPVSGRDFPTANPRFGRRFNNPNSLCFCELPISIEDHYRASISIDGTGHNFSYFSNGPDGFVRVNAEIPHIISMSPPSGAVIKAKALVGLERQTAWRNEQHSSPLFLQGTMMLDPAHSRNGCHTPHFCG